MELKLEKGLQVLLALACALFLANMSVAALVGGGALDPERFSVGGGDARPLVVASTTILDDIVLRVAGDHVQRELIVGPGGDPHVYEPTPRDQVAITQADLVVLNGFGLEPKIEKMVEATEKPHERVVEAAEGLTPVPEPDDPRVPDPHLWMSIPLVYTYVDNVRDALIRVDPEHAHAYRANADAFRTELVLVDREVRGILDTIPEENRKIVTTHDAFRYFGEEYGVDVVDTIWGVSTDSEPTPEDMRRIVENIRAENVPAVFVESSVRTKDLETVAAEAGVAVGGTLYADSLGLPGSGAHTFTTMMLANANTLAGGLGGEPREVTT